MLNTRWWAGSRSAGPAHGGTTRRRAEWGTLRRPCFERPVVIAVFVVALLALGQEGLAETSRPPQLGLRATREGERLVVTWVQPAGPGWDAGIRPGDTVTGIAGRAVALADGPDIVATAPSIRVRARDGGTVDASADAVAATFSVRRRVVFLATAACLVAVGGGVYVLAAEVVAARALLGFSATAATMLVAAVAAVSGAPWALALVYVAVVSFGATAFLLFLVFPVSRLGTRPGRLAATGCLLAAAVLVVFYYWAVAFHPTAYSGLKRATFGVVAADLLGAGALVVTAFAERSQRREARRALGLVVVGTLSGLAPFCLLAIAPYALGLGYILAPDVAIVSLALLPASIAAAVLSRKFFGIDRPVRRSLVALVVWVALLAAYCVGLLVMRRAFGAPNILPGSILASPILYAAAAGAAFAPVQARLRRALERALFRDVYNYPETLRQLGTELVDLENDEAIAAHVLERLSKTLNLRWASLVLGPPPPVAFHWGDPAVKLEPQALLNAAEAAECSGSQHAAPAGDHACLVPLVTNGLVSGVLVVGPKQHGAEFVLEDVQLLATLMPLVTIALKDARLARRLSAQMVAMRDREQALSALSAQLLHVREAERKRLAQDLHDGPLRAVLELVRRADGVADAVAVTASGPSAPGSVHERLRALAESGRDAVDELRLVCVDLYAPELAHLGIAAALQQLARTTSREEYVTVEFSADTFPEGHRLPEELEETLYRITREALDNVCRHAHATRARIVLGLEQGSPAHTVLTVCDDGCGFAVPASLTTLVRAQHLGLVSMRERVECLRGTFAVTSAPGEGAEISVRVPVLPYAARPNDTGSSAAESLRDCRAA